MKSLKVIIEGKEEFEIKVNDKDLNTLVKIIKVFESKGK